MSSAREAGEEAAEKAPRKKGGGASHLLVLVLAMVVTVLGVAGGVLFWLIRSGRLPVQSGTAQAQVQIKGDPPKTRMIVLDPLLVNLADPGGTGYLRVVVALRIEDPAPVKGEKPKEDKPVEKGRIALSEDEVRMRDAALSVLGRETSERLLQPEGKDRLKAELHEAFSAHVPEVKVTDILYTEFLVQR